MSVFTLKCLAMLTMLCDHAGLFLMGNLLPMRCIGRFSFIAYAFLLAEGYVHQNRSKSAEKEHLKMLLLLIIPGEFVFDCALFGRISFSSQSVLITLLLGYCGMIASNRLKNFNYQHLITAVLFSSAALLAYLLHSDYSFAGVLLIAAFYYYAHEEGKMPPDRKIIFLLCLGLCYTALESLARFGFCTLQVFIENSKKYSLWNLSTVISFLPLASYNGNRGINPPFFKLLYRSFYPVHLFAIILLRELK